MVRQNVQAIAMLTNLNAGWERVEDRASAAGIDGRELQMIERQINRVQELQDQWLDISRRMDRQGDAAEG